jgi:hypothetical protein
MSDKKLEQRISIKFCGKIGTSGSETTVLLTMAYAECVMKKLSVLEWHRRLEKGKMCKLIREVGSQNAKDKCKYGEIDLGALRSKIRCETNSRLDYGNLFRGIEANSGQTNLFFVMIMPQLMMR